MVHNKVKPAFIGTIHNPRTKKANFLVKSSAVKGNV